MKQTAGRVAQNIPSVAMVGVGMLGDLFRPRLSEFDLQVFEAFVPPDHDLRRVLEVIAWGDFDDILAPYYSADLGRPPECPVLMLKLEYLRYHHRLSDRQVIERAKTDLAFRYFLQVDRYHQLVDPSSLCRFRGRLGKDGFRTVFDKVVATARKHGIVKDRLRIKDATHVIADIAIPTTLALVAQTRDKLLAAAEPFDSLRVEGERINIELLRESTKGQKDQVRLLTRVTHLREMLAWIDELPTPEDAVTNGPWQTLLEQRQLAHKILQDQENPKAGDKTRSTVDPEARCGKHGDWYDGYLLDIIIDGDSEIITQINVLPANGEEAADAIELIRQEEAVHDNDIESLSIDGAGYSGPVLRELEDPDGLAVDTYVPPKAEPASDTFGPDDFVEDAESGTVICPAGKKSRYRERCRRGTATVHRFARADCQGCALLGKCMEKPPKYHGRTVHKNDYEKEYRRVRQKATTEAYASVRAEHRKVERKLGEVTNRHGGRRARYHGTGKVLIQELMACTATNIKRILRLLCAPPAAPAHGT
jgi:IS5 family transposase